MVVNVNPVVLPRDGTVRKPPRPMKHRQADYEENFDYQTLFYDSIPTDTGIDIIGPPMLNLEPLVAGSLFEGSSGIQYEVSLVGLDRTSIVRLTGPVKTESFISMNSEAWTRTIPLSRNYQQVFADRRTLITKSKNNDLKWITDWVRFHVEEHDIDGVLLYDNGSTEYGPEDVLEAVVAGGAEHSVVVSWPFKFGPQGGNWNGLKGAPWDSDYCEYGIMEHARRAFLGLTDGVLNLDIDELLPRIDGRSVFDLISSKCLDGVSFRGRWIEAVSGDGKASGRHSDYWRYDPDRSPTTPKWAVNTKRVLTATQWKTHKVNGAALVQSPEIRHRHFMAITRNWKWHRTSITSLSDDLVADTELRESLLRVFPERG